MGIGDTEKCCTFTVHGKTLMDFIEGDIIFQKEVCIVLNEAGKES